MDSDFIDTFELNQIISQKDFVYQTHEGINKTECGQFKELPVEKESIQQLRVAVHGFIDISKKLSSPGTTSFQDSKDAKDSQDNYNHQGQ